MMSTRLLAISALLLLLSGCQTLDNQSTDNALPAQTVLENGKVGPACLDYFDGCNQCRRMYINGPAACTKKACQTYKKPVCHKTASADMPTYSEFRCGEGTIIVIHHADSARISGAMLAEPFELPRVTSASGLKYADGQRAFWQKVDEATLQLSQDGDTVQCQLIPR
ncbi:MliC family protein [Aestuariibacter halophilus]|uniref:MliC family protein n=1 Tax=Fluctibacter halophilus TaxID=226011 RepID=A0ABS8G568_9ALTE|nr:MliC family protein [Aestuariibacter halophilus]MCC2615695.1 MliC family protein [Aestuariibacter halophilus]